MSKDSYYVTDDGRAMCRCYDCNRTIELAHGKRFNIETDAAGKVVAVLCDDCYELLERSRRAT